MSKEQPNGWERLLFSATLENKKASHKLAYIAVMTAFSVVANMFFEFKLADTQFSFTIVVSALTGILIGPLFGFAACFLGDLVGFLYHSAGFAYMPWIGISMGLTAFLAGLFRRRGDSLLVDRCLLCRCFLPDRRTTIHAELCTLRQLAAAIGTKLHSASSFLLRNHLPPHLSNLIVFYIKTFK